MQTNSVDAAAASVAGAVSRVREPVGCPAARQHHAANRPGVATGADDLHLRERERSREAVEFLGTFFAERHPAGVDPGARIAEVVAEIAATGTYRHTSAELAFGCRLAWRQSARCVGRIRWQSLVVRDRRDVDGVDRIAVELVGHLTAASRGSKIRNVITVFAQDDPAVGPSARVWNDQLIRYAGHRMATGVVGDPAQADFTESVTDMGWQPAKVPGRFDVLPWVIETWREKPTLVPIPRRVVQEVQLSHPQFPWLAELGLLWHVLPVVSNMRLRVGGVDYSCAPFSGFYLGDEIATRNLGDVDRYNQLPVIAAGLGLDTGDRASMWREHAALVLNQAVLHSFITAGVPIADGFQESSTFAQFAAREEAAGRTPYGDWAWINGYFGHSLGPAFHRYYDTGTPDTCFWLDADRLATTLVDLHAAAPGGAVGGPG